MSKARPLSGSMPNFYDITDEEWNRTLAEAAKHDDYKREYIDLNEPLGHGTFGDVFLVQAKVDNSERAVKLVKVFYQEKEFSKPKKQMLVTEVKALNRLKPHVNVLHLFNTYTGKVDKTKTEFYMVTNYANRNSLYKLMLDKSDPEEKRINSMDPKRAKKLIVQIVTALNHCFANGVVHRDLKLGNVLIDYRYNREFAILSDFGLAQVESKKKDLDTNFMIETCGYYKYRCPEMLNKKHYSFRCDIWSLGVLIFVMLTASYPFDGKDSKEVKELVRNPPIYRDDVWLEDEEMSMAKLLLERSLLCINPMARLKYTEILRDPWLDDKHYRG